MHPGPISNRQDLSDQDEKGLNLYGTGSLKELPAEYVDVYLKGQVRSNYDYLIVN